MRDGTEPTQEILDKYAAVFLLGKPLGYDTDALLKMIDSPAGQGGQS